MKTIIAFVDKYKDAEGLVQDLTDRGFRRESIEIGRTAKGEVERGEKREGFFQKLFGSSKEHKHEGVRGYYPEAPHGESAFIAISASEADALLATEILRRHGVDDIEERPEDWRLGSARFEGREPSTLESEGEVRRETSLTGAEEEVVPVVEEEVRVGKREVPKGKVHVTSHVTETPVEEDVSLREEHATVERRKVDRPLSAADEAEAFQEASYEVRESAEEPVVAKEARVKEEVVIGKEETERTEKVRGTARRTDVDVEEEEFGRFYNTLPAGEDYEGHKAAYRYGADLRRENRFEGRTWPEVEEDVRADWESGRPGTWNKYRDTVRHRWERRD